jgi:hypothetical protein
MKEAKKRVTEFTTNLSKDLATIIDEGKKNKAITTSDIADAEGFSGEITTAMDKSFEGTNKTANTLALNQNLKIRFADYKTKVGEEYKKKTTKDEVDGLTTTLAAGAADEKKELDKQMAAFKKEYNLTDDSAEVKTLNNTIKREFEKLEANVEQQADQQKFEVDKKKAEAMTANFNKVEERVKNVGIEIAEKTSLKGLKEKKAVKETDAAKKATILSEIATLDTAITKLNAQKTQGDKEVTRIKEAKVNFDQL